MPWIRSWGRPIRTGPKICSSSPPTRCSICTATSTTSAGSSRFRAPDELRPDQIDDAIRKALPKINAERVNSRLEEIGDAVSRGLVASDIADIARAAVAGAVSTLVYNFTVDVLGLMNDATGEVDYTPEGYDLLSRIAVTVLDKGGRVVAVRNDEISAGIWNGTAIAKLRFALS